VFELTGIDLHTTSKADLHKDMHDRATSVMNFAPETHDRALSALRLTPEVEPPNPPTSPEQDHVPEVIVTANKEVSTRTGALKYNVLSLDFLLKFLYLFTLGS